MHSLFSILKAINTGLDFSFSPHLISSEHSPRGPQTVHFCHRQKLLEFSQAPFLMDGLIWLPPHPRSGEFWLF